MLGSVVWEFGRREYLGISYGANCAVWEIEPPPPSPHPSISVSMCAGTKPSSSRGCTLIEETRVGRLCGGREDNVEGGDAKSPTNWRRREELRIVL